jgi:16S rRNA (cytidine1402-2'-O)-methyltransferase
MPVISDPGRQLIREAISSGIKVEIVPGASALTMAIAGASIEADFTTFVGFPPSRSGERRRWLGELSRLPGALVLFEAPHRLRQTLEDVQAVLGDRPVVVAHELTKLHESWHRGLARELLTDPLLPEKGEFTLVIGPSSEEMPAPVVPDATTVWHEFGRLTKTAGRGRKEAIAELAEKYRLPKRKIYALVEAAKESGE